MIASWMRELFYLPSRGPYATTPQPEIARDKVLLGNQARRLLDDPVLQLAFQDAEAEALRRWKDVKGTPETRERAFHMHVAIQEVRARLHSYLGNVKLFEAEQKRQEKA